jgi:hypothetical protein
MATAALYIRVAKTPGSAQKDACLLQQIFGPVCGALKTNSRAPGTVARRGPNSGQKPRTPKTPPIEARDIEEINPAQITAFITASVRYRGLSPRSANRFREILSRLFSWLEHATERREDAQRQEPRPGLPAIRAERAWNAWNLLDGTPKPDKIVKTVVDV